MPCGICKLNGHNAKTCPNRNSEIDITNKSKKISKVSIQYQRVDIEYVANYRTEEEVIEYQKMMEAIKNVKEREHKKICGNNFWFKEQEVVAWDIFDKLYIKKNTVVLIVAEPGVGKTNLIHVTYYTIRTHLPYQDAIIGDRITILTGMSDCAWKKQTKDALPLMLENEEVYHQGTLAKRFKYLSTNVHLLSDHLFIIDEAHIACADWNTIACELKFLGLDKEMIKKLNIKFILISATPDAVLAFLKEFGYDEDYNIIELKPGENYKGFGYFMEKGFIEDYEDLSKTENCDKFADIIKERYGENPKHHIIRIRGSSTNKKEMIENIEELCRLNKWHCDKHNQEKRQENFDDILDNKPKHGVHNFWLIMEFYKASKRLKINEYTGCIIEPAAKQEDVTVTSNGLIPRFWGYYPDDEIGQYDPTFICNKISIEKYIEFTKNWSFEGIDYSSRMVKCGKTRFPTYLDGSISKKEKIPPQINPDSYRLYDSRELNDIDVSFKNICNHMGYGFREADMLDGFMITSLNKSKQKTSIDNAITAVSRGYGGAADGSRVSRSYYPCYGDMNDSRTLHYVLIIRPGDEEKLTELDEYYPCVEYIN